MAIETGLTIGQVAAIISGCQSLVQAVLPQLLSVILLGALNGRLEYQASDLAAVGQILQSSWWATIHGSVPSTITFRWPFFRKTVDWNILTISQTIIAGNIILLVANFLTAIPLIGMIEVSSQTISAEFQYVPVTLRGIAKDESFFGLGSLPVPESGINRICTPGNQIFVDCPGSIYNDPVVRGKYKDEIIINSTIPFETLAPFQRQTGTVADPTDIQYRNWYKTRRKNVDDNSLEAFGWFRPLVTNVLSDSYIVVEGLIVNTKSGGVGLRNHTMPVGLKLGGVWTEDILWVEPETSCTPNNLSLHFLLKGTGYAIGEQAYLQDSGGFADLSLDPPLSGWDNYSSETWKSVQNRPDLKDRSGTLAWWNNQFIAKVLSITTSVIGRNFSGEFSHYARFVYFNSIRISSADGKFLNGIYFGANDADRAVMHDFQSYSDVRCAGYSDVDASSSTKPFIRCGYLYGSPIPESASHRADAGSRWRQELYTCASSVKASVKSVTFSNNGTFSLSSLRVVDVRSKIYDKADMPYWGVEKASGYTIDEIKPFWGLVDVTQNSNAIKILHVPELYLPATNTDSQSAYPDDRFALGSAFTSAWNDVYKNAAGLGAGPSVAIPSYGGELNNALASKWSRLSGNADGAAQILNLIWTDIVSFAVVSTRTGFETDTKKQGPGQVLGKRDVREYVVVIGYSNFWFALPAVLALAILTFSIVFVLGFHSIQPKLGEYLKHVTRQTEMTRAVVQIKNPDAAWPDQRQRDWQERARNGVLITLPGLPGDNSPSPPGKDLQISTRPEIQQASTGPSIIPVAPAQSAIVDASVSVVLPDHPSLTIASRRGTASSVQDAI